MSIFQRLERETELDKCLLRTWRKPELVSMHVTPRHSLEELVEKVQGEG